MIEFQDRVADLDPELVPLFVREFLWTRWDQVRDARVKLHWGIVRPSFRLRVFEPVVVKLIGPRPVT